MKKITHHNHWHTLILFFITFLLIETLSGCVLIDPKQKQPDPFEYPTPPVTTEPNIETTASNPVTGVVNAKELKIRTGVGDFHDQIGTIKEGDIIEILERTEVNGIPWGRIAQGWICLSKVTIEGEENNVQTDQGSTEESSVMIGSVIAEELNLRSGPGTKYEVVKRLKYGDKVAVTEMDGTWGKTEDGWLNTVFAYFPDSLDPDIIKATITADILNVRAGPGTSYESIRKLESGTEVEIIKQVTIRGVQWGYIKQGWISMEHVKTK